MLSFNQDHTHKQNTNTKVHFKMKVVIYRKMFRRHRNYGYVGICILALCDEQVYFLWVLHVMITTVMFDVLLQVLLGDVGAGKSSLVLRFVKEQFVEFQVCFISFKGRIFFFIHTFTFIVCYYKNQLPPLVGGIIFTTHSKQRIKLHLLFFSVNWTTRVELQKYLVKAMKKSL